MEKWIILITKEIKIKAQCDLTQHPPEWLKTKHRKYRWPTNIWKDAQYLSLLEKCKSKLQWGTTSHWSQWPSSKNLQTVNAGGGVEKREPSLHCWWECKFIQPLWKTLRESVPRQVDKESRGPQGERGLEFSRRKKGQTFFFLLYIP